MASLDVIPVVVCVCVCVCVCGGGGGGLGALIFFFIRRLGPSIYHSPQKYQEFQAPPPQKKKKKKIYIYIYLEFYQPPQNIPIL